VADANDASHSSRGDSASSSSDASSTSTAALAALALPSLDLPSDPQHGAAAAGDAALASAGTFSRFLLMNAQPNPMLTIVEENSADLSSMTPEKRASVRSVMYTPVGDRGDRKQSSSASAGAAVRAPHGVPSPLASSPSSSSSSSSSVAFYSHATGESTPQSRRIASPSFASSPVADRVVRSAAAESADEKHESIPRAALPVLMPLPAHVVSMTTSATVHPLPLDLISSASASASSGSATGALFDAAADASLCIEPSGDQRQMHQHHDAGQRVAPLALQPALALAAASEPSALRAAADEECYASSSSSSSSSSVYLTASAAEYSAASAQLQLSARGAARLDAAQARLMLAVSAPATGAGANAAAAASKGGGD
jgi:hypothetical protein